MADEVETAADATDEGAESPSSPEAAGADDGAAAGSPPASSDASDPESPSGEGAASDSDEPEEFRNALGKHKGDKAAFGRHYFQTQQDNARFTRENDQLKARLAEVEAGRPGNEKVEREPEPEPDLAPELQELETYLGSLEEEKKALPQVQQERIDAVVKAHETVIRLETRLETADEMDKPSWETKVHLAKQEHRDAGRAYQDSVARGRQLEGEIKRTLRERDTVKRHFDSEKERQKQADRERTAFNESFPREADALITSAFEGLGVPKDEKLRTELWEGVNESLMVQLWRLKNVPMDQVDLPKLVKSTVEKQIKRHDYTGRFKFAQASKDKLKVASTTPARPTAPTTPADPRRAPMPYEVSDRDPKLEAARKRLAKLGV